MQSSKIYGQEHCIHGCKQYYYYGSTRVDSSGDWRDKVEGSLHPAIVSSRQLCSVRSRILAYDLKVYAIKAA